MKIHQVKRTDYSGYCDKECELSDYEVRHVPNWVQEAWYWYFTGWYEGTGHILMRDEEGLWHTHNMGHCSCYGPTDEIPDGKGEPLADLLASCTQELRDELKPLTDAIEKARTG